jgi:type I restriction enzyme S subunit
MSAAKWKTVPFEAAVHSRGSGSSGLAQKEWLAQGKFPVIGQGAEDIEGWTDREDLLLTPTPAVVLYGGHTRRAKHVSQSFVPGPNVKILQPNSSIDSKFLFYFLTYLPIESKGYADHFPLVRKCDVPVPPLSEQQGIVGILDEAFEGIATVKANAEKNLQNARTLFESHLQSVFTQRGEGWKQKTLEEVATIFGRGKSRHRPRNAKHLYGGKYPFIQTGDIRNADHLITEHSQTYSDAGLAQSKLWPKGTICITIAANIAETGILDFDACFPDSVIGMVTNPDEADLGFVEYLLQSFKVRLQAKGKGSAQANINMGTFENERFPFPSLAEQKRIVAQLDSLAVEAQRLESIYQQKLTALEALKKSLLHQAFTGQL